jgi:hypothetical protein
VPIQPIGLAIKHKYGLSTATGDYESRRILEKFVDVYVDMAEPTTLDAFVRWLWLKEHRDIGRFALIIHVDDEYVQSDPSMETTRNVTALQAIKTDNQIYGNLRLLRKTMERACARQPPNGHMLWTIWHLELAQQMYPDFRREIATTSSDLVYIALESHRRVLTSTLTWNEATLNPESNSGGTLFGAYRSAFWDACKVRLAEVTNELDPESRERARILVSWMADYRRMDFLIIMSLLPGDSEADVKQIVHSRTLDKLFRPIEQTIHQFGWLLANY